MGAKMAIRSHPGRSSSRRSGRSLTTPDAPKYTMILRRAAAAFAWPANQGHNHRTRHADGAAENRRRRPPPRSGRQAAYKPQPLAITAATAIKPLRPDEAGSIPPRPTRRTSPPSPPPTSRPPAVAMSKLRATSSKVIARSITAVGTAPPASTAAPASIIAAPKPAKPRTAPADHAAIPPRPRYRRRRQLRRRPRDQALECASGWLTWRGAKIATWRASKCGSPRRR